MEWNMQWNMERNMEQHICKLTVHNQTLAQAL